LFTGDTALARKTIGESAPARFVAQIAPDGSQPEELARTRPLHYSLFNLEPFYRLAEMGRHVGVDLWHYRATNGANFRSALMYLAPYLDPSSKFPKPEITPAHQEEFLRTIRQAQQALHDPALDAAVARMHAEVLRTDRSRLMYPDAPVLSADAAHRSLDSLLHAALRFSETQLRRTAESLDPANGYPRVTKPDGSWEVQSATAWTSGFFAGSLWQMYAMTRAPAWTRLAERWTVGLEPNKSRTNTHDLGFLIFDSFGLGYELTREPRYKSVVLDASRSLATRFNPTVGAIKSWDTEGVSDRRNVWKYPVIVDNLMNLEMLFWASDNGGDPSWRALAERHALTSSKAHLRPNGSTNHVALFDPATGSQTGRVTWQGYSDSSVWSRGQAWAIHGLTRSAIATGNPELLAAARRAADWMVAHLPPDGIPPWDFSDPRGPVADRDASAAAITASGLLMLAGRVDAASMSRYSTAAQRILRTLSASYSAVGTPNSSVLLHSVGQLPQGVEIDVGIVYADYYFLEGIRRYRAFERGDKVW
jgi:unsaturated chondroitin disaccharide hydrolase